ncbi:hypothetical protein DIPPA_05626, partial [Diplonema papillatum]
EYEAQKAQMTREGREREGITLEEARQWPRRSLQLQVGEREGRRDVAFLEAAEATEALAQMKEDKERRLALALAALAIKKDPPGPPGCDVLMGSQRPEADPPQPGEHKDPGSDAPMGEAQGPGPGLPLPKALQLAATGSVTGWLRLHSFATLVLFKPRRGGRKKVAAALRSRCHLWAHGRFGELWTEAQEVAAGRRQAGVPLVRFLVMDEDDNQIGRFVGLATDVEDADQLDAKTVQQVIRRTKARWFGKAVAALSAAKANAEIDVSWGIVIKTLRALPRGTAPGPSGLSAQHLLDLVSPGSPIRAPLVAVIARIATGSLPDEARPHGFGARLVALEKKDGGLRPIACGEVLRRMAAKILARDKSVVQAVKPILERCGQTGVGMKSGADAMVCAMRCVGEAYRRDGQGRGILKVDLQNAFNKVSREAILQAVAESAPGLLPYAIAAYGRRSRLSFGEEV